MSFWRKEFTPQEIEMVLGKVREARSISPEGKVSVTLLGNIDAWISFLVSALGIEVRTNTLRAHVVRATIFSPDLNVNFTEKDFRTVVYRRLNEDQSQNFKTFKVAFPIWNSPRFLNGVKRIDDVTINFSPSPNTRLFKTICRERLVQRTDSRFEFFFDKERLAELQKCSTCIAHVKANGPEDANERASEAIYEVLGLINMATDWNKGGRWTSRVKGKLPVSEVLIGPHTTTHFSDGTLTHDGFWHEHWNGGPKRSTLTQEKLHAWEKRYNKFCSGVSISPWRKQCKSTAVRYFKAFSNPDLEESFLDGWRLFENIAGSRYEKIETKIVRVSNVFETCTEHQIVGKHLALRRNLISHGHPIKSDDDETLAFQMLQFVLPYAEFFILNGFSFASREQLWEFLDLPDSRIERSEMRKNLHQQLSLLNSAAQFRGEKE